MTSSSQKGGLFGKLFTSQYRVDGYHFNSFVKLNKDGFFLIILDGFDEMKRGMSFFRFQSQIDEFLKLDDGASKILLLGRPTALQNDIEFRAAIGGQITTSLGTNLSSIERRPLRSEEILGFDKQESHIFITKYFSILAKEDARKRYKQVDPEWVEERIKLLISDKFSELVLRPVHAKMLCQIALQSELDLVTGSSLELYDAFMQFLMKREFDKKGRDKRFSVDVRRRFNAAIAWWLCTQGGASTTTISDIPIKLAYNAISGRVMELTDDELKRELIAGCLVENDRGRTYFPHGSFQEFLVAEHLLNTDLMSHENNRKPNFRLAAQYVNAEISDFLCQAASRNVEICSRVIYWLETLCKYPPGLIPYHGIALYGKLAIASDYMKRAGTPNAPTVLIHYYSHCESLDFSKSNGAEDRALESCAAYLNDESPRVRASLIQLIAMRLSESPILASKKVAEMVAMWLSEKEVIELTILGKTQSATIRGLAMTRNLPRDISIFAYSQPQLWLFWRAIDFRKSEQSSDFLNLDLNQLNHDCVSFTNFGVDLGRNSFRSRCACTRAELLEAVKELGWSVNGQKALKELLNNKYSIWERAICDNLAPRRGESV